MHAYTLSVLLLSPAKLLFAKTLLLPRFLKLLVHVSIIQSDKKEPYKLLQSSWKRHGFSGTRSIFHSWNFVPLLICHPATCLNRRAVVIEQAKCTFRHNTTRITYYHCRAEERMSISARLLFFSLWAIKWEMT